MKWFYDCAANSFLEADPIGNGHMGGMVYGGIEEDRIELSELTFFSGEKSTEKDHQENASSSFYKMRELAGTGDYQRVKEEAEHFIGIRNNYGTNLPVGTVSVLLLDKTLVNTAKNYQRVMDFGTGVVSSSFDSCGYEDSKAEVQRECYVSWPDKVMVYHIRVTKPCSFKVTYENTNSHGTVSYKNNQVCFLAKAYETMHSNGTCGVHLSGGIQVKTDGTLQSKEEGLFILQATEVICFIAMQTNFRKCEMELEEKVEKIIQNAMNRSISDIKKRHQEDVCRYMRRVDLNIQGKDAETQLIPSMFQFGRYLLLSSSREDSLLPAHLQGIWNDNVACRIGWTCDMHLDINTQMNYWPAEVTNLTEMSFPLFCWVENILIPSGRISAKKNYGLKGWIGEIVSNSWGFAAPYWASPISPCPTGGLWILSHFWEHVCYTQDKEFLEKHAYPAMYEAAEFFTDYVFKIEDGMYSCGPSISPENSFRVGKNSYQISNGCTYEILMIRELFNQLYEMEEKMGVHSDLGIEGKAYSEKLIPYRICQDGTIAEWSHDYTAADTQHRHTSHLLGLYPFAQITVEDTKELAEAAKNTIEKKSSPPEQWEDTGWARSMMMLYCARLQDGNAAFAHIQCMFRGLLATNHFIIHPPTRGAGSFADVYELDGNTGLTTCIAEMLLQSHNGLIRLLPALPKDWRSGRVAGLKARGNMTVTIEWREGNLVECCIEGNRETAFLISYHEKQIKGVLDKTGKLVLKYQDFRMPEVG